MSTRIVCFCALLLGAGGCATEHYVSDAKHPEVAIAEDGSVTYRGRFVDPEDLPALLRRSGLTKEDTINIHCPDTLRDYRAPRRVMGILLNNGFPRHILVGDRRSFSEAGRTADERRRDRARQKRLEAERARGETEPRRGSRR
ncbi:MAG: hypothetical protein ACI4Q3_05105 [Kiritimatiellia bacterium]